MILRKNTFAKPTSFKNKLKIVIYINKYELKDGSIYVNAMTSFLWRACIRIFYVQVQTLKSRTYSNALVYIFLTKISLNSTDIYIEYWKGCMNWTILSNKIFIKVYLSRGPKFEKLPDLERTFSVKENSSLALLIRESKSRYILSIGCKLRCNFCTNFWRGNCK